MPDRRTAVAWLAAGATFAPQVLWAADVVHDGIPPFKAGGDGTSLAAGWTHQLLPKVDRPNRFSLVQDDGQTVLQVQSNNSASSYLTHVSIDPAKTPFLRWRWKVSRALDGSDITSKAGDDFAARLYVLFDLPLDELSFGDRLKIRAARALTSGEIPTAALCYVWGKAQPVGFTGWNAYTDRLRMIVVDSGSADAGRWQRATRNVADDFRAAFSRAAPPVRGIAIGSDTDNTGESVETWFADLSFSAQR